MAKATATAGGAAHPAFKHGAVSPLRVARTMPVGLDPNDPRVQSAGFAELIADFWKSDIGAYLKAHAQRESDEATKQLVEHAHEMSREEIHIAQTNIWRASKFCEWLEQAYAAGCADLQILEEEHDATRG